MGRSYRVAAIQFEPEFGAIEENVSRMVALCDEAARRRCRLIVLPEMATTGYCFYDQDEIAQFVEPIPGPSTNRLAQVAMAHNCYIVFGLPEVDLQSGIFYNSAALVGPHGLVGKIRKVHPYVADNKWAKDGDLGFPVWDTELGRIGCQICMDACYPEPTRIAALKGADVVCIPTNWVDERAPAADWFTRAFENGVYFIAADRYGLERGVQFSGGSCVIGPNGGLLALQDIGDGVVEAEVDLSSTQERPFQWEHGGDKLQERRPRFYRDLILNPLLWPMRVSRDLYDHRPLPPGKTCGVAVIQMADVARKIGEAREMAEGWIAKAVEEADFPIELVVLPELAMAVDPGRAGEQAETIPGPTSRWAIHLCRNLGIYVVMGLPEQAEGKRFNSAAIFGPKGVVGIYRKIHLSETDRTWATPGDRRFGVWDLPLGRIGLMVGHDAFFPESGRSLAIQGADIICAPSAVQGPIPVDLPPTQVPLAPEILETSDKGYWHLWRTRAAENNCYLAFANRSDGAYLGWSGVFGPDSCQFPRLEQVISGIGDQLARLLINTRDYLAPTSRPNPVRFKELIRMRKTQFYNLLTFSAGSGADPYLAGALSTAPHEGVVRDRR